MYLYLAYIYLISNLLDIIALIHDQLCKWHLALWSLVNPLWPHILEIKWPVGILPVAIKCRVDLFSLPGDICLWNNATRGELGLFKFCHHIQLLRRVFLNNTIASCMFIWKIKYNVNMSLNVNVSYTFP